MTEKELRAKLEELATMLEEHVKNPSGRTAIEKQKREDRAWVLASSVVVELVVAFYRKMNETTPVVNVQAPNHSASIRTLSETPRKRE